MAGPRGRRSERVSLDQPVTSVREGHSRLLVLRGEAGIGRTALSEYLASRAPGCRTVRAAAFAGLHQLCAPLAEAARTLPSGQRPPRLACAGSG